MTPLRIGTRGSPLALWQAEHVAARLRQLTDRPIELVLVETRGDQIRDRPLSQIGGDGLFTKEVQNALLDGRADLAVHSLKDLPTTPLADLQLIAVPERGPVGDVFVSRRYTRFDELPPGARLATSSLRRRSQILLRRPDLTVVDLRGNVETRLRKLDEEQLDGIILAAAGLERLGLHEHITEELDRSWMLPAVGQGALGLECRTEDEPTRALVAHLNHPPTWSAVIAERAFLRGLGGGCLVPIGALGEIQSSENTIEQLRLRGIVLASDGSRHASGSIQGPMTEAESLGITLAQQLLDKREERST